MNLNLSILPDFPIKTHHIKSLHAPVGQCYFISSQPSMFLLQKSLCEQKKTQNNKLTFNQQTLLNNGDKSKNLKGTSRDLQTNVIVSEQDVNKLLTQIIQKGKKIDFLLRSYLKINFSQTSSKQDFQKYCSQNSYLKSTSELILNEYFKKRKLGPKLRGLNNDLLNEIENKLFSLIQAQFKIWAAKRQAQKIEFEFYKKAQEMQTFLQNMGQETAIQ